jgi:hypothetical protein
VLVVLEGKAFLVSENEGQTEAPPAPAATAIAPVATPTPTDAPATWSGRWWRRLLELFGQ